MTVKEFKQFVESINPLYDSYDLGAVDICFDCDWDTLTCSVNPATYSAAIFSTDDHAPYGDSDVEEMDFDESEFPEDDGEE